MSAEIYYLVTVRPRSSTETIRVKAVTEVDAIDEAVQQCADEGRAVVVTKVRREDE